MVTWSTNMAQSVATVTVNSRCIFRFKWSQVRIHKASLLLLSPRFFKKASGILQSPPSVRPSVCPSVCPSVRPSRYLLLNHWTKSNQIWCVGCSHEWGVQRHNFFLPRPLGPWGGAKRSNIIKYL